MARSLRRNATRDYTIGRRAFAKISAVEGIHMTDAMEADFREFDRKNLSPASRRRAITKKFAPAISRG
jgi:hypothetical protein